MDTPRPNINQRCQNCPNYRGNVRTQERTAPPRQAQQQPQRQPAPPPARSTSEPALGRTYLAAYAQEFKLVPTIQGAAIPFEPVRTQGGFALEDGVVTVPSEGYYMLLWELGITDAPPGATLHLGINDTGVPIIPELRPGYDSGQQVTWLAAGDKLSLRAHGDGDETAQVHGGSAQVTLLRMG